MSRRGSMVEVNKTLVEQLSKVAEVRLAEPLARHTTFGIGGPADVYVIVRSAAELRDSLALCRKAECAPMMLGNGSNLLVSDLGIRGVVIDNRARGVEGPLPTTNGNSRFRVESGINLASLARDLASKGFAGLEWAAGIPGTIGGAVVFNASAYDGSMANVLKSVGIVCKTGLEYELGVEELGLGYRESAFTRQLFVGHVILWADLLLKQGDAAELQHRLDEMDRNRQASQPRGRSAGSIFKNTHEYPAWWLLDQVGLRGHRIGDAEFSSMHPNFIINVGRATAADVSALIDIAREKITSAFAVNLQTEIAFVGEGF